MNAALMLLATFLSVVLVGGALVALHDALERTVAVAARARRSPVGRGFEGHATPGVRLRRLH